MSVTLWGFFRIRMYKPNKFKVMGGFTKIRLSDISQENIDKHNQMLKDLKAPKWCRFYSEKDVKFEYEGFVNGEGEFPEHLFPRDKINSYEDFKRYWSPEALGEVFVPKFGTLTFDCYFGRTSKRAMNIIGKYLVENCMDVEEVGGSYSTFVERSGLSKKDKEYILILDKYFHTRERAYEKYFDKYPV